MNIGTSQATAAYLNQVLAAANATNANTAGNAANTTQSLFPNETPQSPFLQTNPQNIQAILDGVLRGDLSGVPTLQSAGLNREDGSMNNFVVNLNKQTESVKKPQAKAEEKEGGGGGFLDSLKKAAGGIAKAAVSAIPVVGKFLGGLFG